MSKERPIPFGRIAEGLDIARSLGQLLDQFGPVLVSEGLGHLGKRRPDRAGGRTA